MEDWPPKDFDYNHELKSIYNYKRKLIKVN